MASTITFRYFHYRRSVEPILRRHPKVRKKLEVVTEDLVQMAKGFAPVGFTGDYRAGIESVIVMRDQGLVGRVVATDFKARWIEWGTSDTEAFHPLQRAGQASGLPFRPSS